MPATDEFLVSEKKFLDSVYHTYTIDTCSTNRVMRSLIMRVFSPYLTGGRALELGCSDGFMTEMISKRVDHLDVVDGSVQFLEEARKRNLPKVDFHYSLFEEYAPVEKYDFVIASFILEHVFDPVAVLNMVRSVLKPGGLLCILVPNARALSRQLGLHMGLLNDLKELTPNDHKHGHRRVYDRVSLNRDIDAAGFESIAQGGILLKILADFQMDELIDKAILKDEQIDGLFSLGMEFPDLCGALFSVCRIKP